MKIYYSLIIVSSNKYISNVELNKFLQTACNYEYKLLESYQEAIIVLDKVLQGVKKFSISTDITLKKVVDYETRTFEHVLKKLKS